LKSIGYDELIIDDFLSVSGGEKKNSLLFFSFFKTLVEKLELCPDNLTVEKAKETFCDKMTSDYMIMYMRMLTSGYIKMNPFMFEGYIEAESID